MKLLLTCEHGGNRVPQRYRPLFRLHRHVLESHRGYDAGALAYARDFAKAFDAPLVYSTTTRLLVELNRSTRHPALFSSIARTLGDDERERVLANYYRPYRTRIESQVAEAHRRRDRLVHISCHSFTPKLNGEVRNADIGLLYDPRRANEVHLCRVWQEILKSVAPQLHVRRNYPYRGTDDGLTTYLRSCFEGRTYCGIEVEVNQKHALREAASWRAFRRMLVESLRKTLATAF
ncbi:MAG: N-formylglutamate amidohydrolase [Burkholderiales bacterium]